MLDQRHRNRFVGVGEVLGAAAGYGAGSALGPDPLGQCLGVALGVLFGLPLTDDWLAGWKH